MRKRRRRVSIEVEKRLRELVRENFTPAQIYDQLYQEFPEGAVPTDRTIRNYVKELRPPDPSGAWSLAGGNEEAAFLLSVLRAVVEYSEGRITQLTRDEVRWIERIRAAVPDIPAATAFLLAREYIRYEGVGQDVAHLDMALALRPTAEETAMALSEPDRKALEQRIARHVYLHVRLWPGRDLTVWARGDWTACLYKETAWPCGGHVIAWDNREGVKFLQLRF